MADAREVLTWSDFGVASRVLATQIAESGYRTDIVIARGGLLPAGALAYALGTKAAGHRRDLARRRMTTPPITRQVRVRSATARP